MDDVSNEHSNKNITVCEQNVRNQAGAKVP